MLTRIHLNNFKCFDALSLPLAPLTVLTGFNAAGKSTALQSLLLLAQSLRSGNRTAELPLNGSLLCPWHGKIKTPQFRIHFEWPRPAGQRIGLWTN